jgi:5'-3' exonuclease
MNITTRAATGTISTTKRYNRRLYDQLPKPIKLTSLRMLEGAFVSGVLDEILQAMIKYSNGHIPVLCHESKPNWRKTVYPEYKGKRKKSADLDWDDFYLVHDLLGQKLAKCKMFIDMKVKWCEGDDIIGTLVLDNMCSDNLVISNDGDFIQLSHKANLISRNAPNGSEWGIQTAEYAKWRLVKKLFTGDGGDNIKPVVPRVTGPKTTDKMIVEGVDPDQSAYSWLDELNGKYPENMVHKRYRRNQVLIDLDRITNEFKVRRQNFEPDFFTIGRIVTEYGLSELQKSVEYASKKLQYRIGT